jgi:GTP:adenosylcobinamide-phosphate guanylyltransferase
MKIVLILAAGLGSRFVPITEYLPKPLVSVQGKPLITYHLEAISELKLPTYINISAHASAMIAYLNKDAHILIEPSCYGPLNSLRKIAKLTQAQEIILISADMFFDSSLLPLRQSGPWLGWCNKSTSQEQVYAGIGCFRTEDLFNSSHKSFKDLVLFCQNHYANCDLTGHAINVGTIQELMKAQSVVFDSPNQSSYLKSN